MVIAPQDPFTFQSIIIGMNSNEEHLNEQALQQQFLSSKLSDHAQPKPSSAFERIREYLFNDVQTCQRNIYLKGKVMPSNNQRNIVRNTKYNIITFIPKVLINQFSHFFNLFFLINSLTQLCPMLRVGLFFTCIGPLLLVLTLTMCKEAYEDIKTHKRDIQANSKQYDVVTSKGFAKVKSKELKVGDIVKIEGGDRIPADMIVLHSNENQGTLFLKTDQLDGQTDWKLRKAVKITQNNIKNDEDVQRLIQSDLFCIVEAPTSEIYNFQGCFNNTQRLTLQNMMWASTVLTNGTVFGLVIYVGRQTRISQGGSSARVKFGILDNQINFLSKILFGIMLLFTVLFIVLQHTQRNYIPIQFMRMLILISSIIPISMRVNLDFAKLYYAYQISKDNTIPGTVVRNTNCPQELGRVKYVLSDKTGTLTKNQMLFKQVSIDYQIKFTNQQINQMRQILCDISGSIEREDISRQKRLQNLIIALSLCHNVTPVSNVNQDEKQYQASSPDEVAFVKLSESLGIQITQRTQSTITLKMPNKRLIQYEIKYIFPFKSQAKRMGIILKNTRSGEYLFFLKGADIVMQEFITNKHKNDFIKEQSEILSMEGLRTLVFACKILPDQFYTKWSTQYQKAYHQLQNNHQEIERLMRELQFGVEFLGLTGIEDKLQDMLTQTIESLRGAGIKIWMITGDKMETAECISRSCKLQTHNQISYKLQNITNYDIFQVRWIQIKRNLNKILIIDGRTLAFIFENKALSTDFFQTALKLTGVIFCRCSPKQKKLITDGVKTHKKPKQAVLGIGDGGNDVGMIQSADVGIGIVGKEGMQAALAADFSIKEFSDLKTLLFWYGRLTYIRSSLLASFIIHRGFIIAAIQIIFSCIFYYVSIPVFNSYLQLGYATIFTFWPVFALILNQDVSLKIALNYPKLYQSLQRAEYLSVFNFFFWIWKAIFQAATIIILTLIMFEENCYLQFETIAFSVLIITEYFMAATEIKSLHFYLIYCIVGSLTCYILCLAFLKSYLHLASLTFWEICSIIFIFFASWGPLFIWKLLRKIIWPNQVEKIMKKQPLEVPRAPFRDPTYYLD